MKKIYFVLALCLGALVVSCSGNKEQKQAEEYLQNILRSPSSFKVIKVEKSQVDASVSYDTIFHINRVYLDKNYYYLRRVESVVIDSIQVFRTDFPAYTNYQIEYDAMNTYGAVLRDEDNVLVCDGKCYFYSEYYDAFSDQAVFDHQEPILLKIDNLSYADDDLQDDTWIQSFELGISYNTQVLDELPDETPAAETAATPVAPKPVEVVEVIAIDDSEPEDEIVIVEEEAEEAEEAESPIFMVVETMPEFPGGQQAMIKFIADNMIYPVAAQEAGIQGRTICQFVVNKDGSISDIEVVRSAGDASLDKEAVRIIKSMPTWKPGKQRGQAVRVKYTTPINFKIQ